MSVHHYMVDYEDERGNLCFANPTDLVSLSKAKTLARKVSKANALGAYVVAFVRVSGSERSPIYGAIGHISFFDGHQSEIDGVVA